MPTASAFALVPPSQMLLPATAALLETATLAAIAVAPDVTTSAALLTTVSLPAPASMPAAPAMASDAEIAAPAPLTDTATLAVGVAASDVTMTAPLFVMLSLPLTVVDEMLPATSTPSFDTATMPSIEKSSPSPSPLIPTAFDSAVVPPFQMLSAASDVFLETATFAVTAVATAVETSSPLLVMVSLPVPPSIAMDVALASDVDTAAAMSSAAMAMFADGVIANAVAVITPSLVMVSSPPACL